MNAFANGSQIGITTGMIRFAQKDEEMGLVIAHELGHNIMDHVSKLRSNSIFPLIFLSFPLVFPSCSLGFSLGFP